MEWELAWIDANLHRYDSPLHAESVKRNIEKRYQLLVIDKRLAGIQATLKQALKEQSHAKT